MSIEKIEAKVEQIKDIQAQLQELHKESAALNKEQDAAVGPIFEAYDAKFDELRKQMSPLHRELQSAYVELTSLLGLQTTPPDQQASEIEILQ
jgi:uncharacterized coiled-coil DUF342 family protein